MSLENAAEENTSLTEDLASAFDGLDDDLETIASNDDEQNADLESDDPIEPQESEGDELSADDPKPEENKLEAPQHWPDADKELFSKQPAEVQEYLLNRHKAMEGDYTKKLQDIAPLREYEPIQKMFEPYLPQLKAANITPSQMIQQWATTAQQLQAKPKETLLRLAKDYGVTFGDQDQETQEFVDPNVTRLQEQLDTLQNSLVQREQSEYQASHNELVDKITAFENEKTEAGEPAHPFFNDVYADMVSLAKAEAQAGNQISLKDLYDKAVWMNPTVREKVLDSQRKADEKKRLEEAKAKAAAAKKASKSVSGSPGGESPAEELDLRQQLESQFQ